MAGQKIVQMLPTITFGDGVSNDALMMDRILREMGYKTGIYAQNIGSRLPVGVVQKVEKLPKLSREDVVLYHFSTGTELNRSVANLPCRKVMVYHNITPKRFLLPYNADAAVLCDSGRKDLAATKDMFELCIADSDYNRQELLELGYSCRTEVLPIVIPFEDYEKEPDRHTLEKYKDDKTNLLFVGRIAPNKCQEDVIGTFYYYHTYINPESRLFLVGSEEGMERYRKRLEEYAEKLGIKDSVVFTGKIKFAEILAYYRLADAFVCMSEHEGFCIPLLEAMKMEVPVVAYDAAAVGETMGDVGIRLKEKDLQVAAEWVHQLCSNEKLREKVITDQKKRLDFFAAQRTEQQFRQIVESLAV
ncbi:MAG: glycosyltransferase family 4 protein [Lachnospiraceae bacterium]|nr:glycosyltransferase family 4 protein [Lachnospiraceae bacterium]